MGEYSHNGKTVRYQEIIDKSFLQVLAENGIRPAEIPDPDLRYRVFSYTVDGNHRYAAVIVANAPDAYIERVFITETIPEDGFWNMMMDVSRQNSGGKPEEMESRLHLAGVEAHKKALEYIQEKYSEQAGKWMLSGYPAEIENEIREEEKRHYLNYGYTLEILDMIEVHDVDMEYVKNILK